MKRMNSKTVVLLIAIAMLLTVTVGGTVAYLAASTQPVVNVFTPGSVGGEIEETLDGQVKKNVTVKNTGNVAAYIRAKIVVTWQNSKGQVYPVMPKLTDNYTMEIGSDWTLDDGFYYYNGKVGAGNPTSALIVKCEPVGECPDTNYKLHVEILAQAIQAEPDDAVTNAWGEVAANLVKPAVNNN